MSAGAARVKKLVSRYPEPFAYAAVTLLAALALSGLGMLSSAVGWALLGAVAAVSVTLARTALREAAARRDDLGPGLVEIVERRIAYFGPDVGGVISLDALTRIDISGAPGGRCWILSTPDPQERLVIPLAASGADGLLKSFESLPGFSAPRAARAMGDASGGPIEIWRRAE